VSPTPQLPIRWTRVHLFVWHEKPYQQPGSTQKQIRNKVTLKSHVMFMGSHLLCEIVKELQHMWHAFTSLSHVCHMLSYTHKRMHTLRETCEVRRNKEEKRQCLYYSRCCIRSSGAMLSANFHQPDSRSSSEPERK